MITRAQVSPRSPGSSKALSIIPARSTPGAPSGQSDVGHGVPPAARAGPAGPSGEVPGQLGARGLAEHGQMAIVGMIAADPHRRRPGLEYSRLSLAKGE